MSHKNGFEFLILLWCICLLTKIVYPSSIRINPNDEDTASKLKKILLKKLDLEEEPTNLGDTNVPNYLLELFETNSLFENNRILLLNNSNTVRSHPFFGDLDNRPEAHHETRSTVIPSLFNKTGFIIKFNLNLPKKETLNGAEFRLYMNISASMCTSQRQRITINQIIRHTNCTLESVHKNLIQFTGPQYTTATDEENLIYRQIDSLMIVQDESKWLQFDVLPAIESWMFRASSNHGLLIKSNCVTKNDLNFNENNFSDNLVFRPSDSDQYDSLKPVILTYSNLQSNEYDVESNSPLDLMKKKKRHVNLPQEPSAVRNKKDWKNGNDCSIHSMYVDFKEIGWQDWILAPRGYDALFCYGDCSLSVIRDGNVTNHATMQSLSNGIHPDIVPPPCCVPTELAPITMIYKEGNTSVLKIYESMIVKRCGCV